MAEKEDKAELYERTTRTSADAAEDETLDPELRAYYAGIALYYDRKAERERQENS